jgi:ribosome-associated translation inhibitor RaiA
VEKSICFLGTVSPANGTSLAAFQKRLENDYLRKDRSKRIMEIPLQITFRNMAPSQAIEDNIREKVSKLESFYDRIMSCRVIVEAPHRHHRKGKAYEVRIDLTVPGGELVVNRAPKRLETAKLRLQKVSEKEENELIESHEPSKHAAHEDIYVAIRDAFNAAGRKLEDHAR